MKNSEKELYQVLEKTKKAGTFNFINQFIERVINLYMKRFGDIKYAKSISEDEFILQLLDCVNHVVAIDLNAKKNFLKVLIPRTNNLLL